jgi:hypothetical protein
MTIQLDISHPNRLAVGVARGTVTIQEYGKFIADLVQAGVLHYRKIIDVTDAKSSTVGLEELRAFDQSLRGSNHVRRGPLAIVADRQRGELARNFKALTSAERPIEVFGSIHDARAWLAKFPVDE